MKLDIVKRAAVLLTVAILIGIFSGCNARENEDILSGSSVDRPTSSNADTPTTDSNTDEPTDSNTDESTGTPDDAPTVDPPPSGTEPPAPTVPSVTPPSGDDSEPEECVHKWEITNQTAATCTADGSKTAVCAKCGNSKTETLTATGHNWDKGTVTTAPVSCSDIGTKTYTCKVCSHTKTEKINGKHSFGQWQWEEYEYTVDYGKDHPGYVPGFPTTATYTSHRKIHTCTLCGYKETDGTKDHPCKQGSINHKVTTVKEGSCTTMTVMRSTCMICGWYVEYERDNMDRLHAWESETRHLTDYTETTDELDVEILTCTACGHVEYYYRWGKGPCICGRTPCVAENSSSGCASYCRSVLMYGDYRITFRSRWTVFEGAGTKGMGDSYYVNDDVNPDGYILHPTWQRVIRDYVFNEEGILVQFTVKWYDINGNPFSEVVNVPDVPQRFLDGGFEEGFDPSRVTMHLAPHKGKLWAAVISWTG